MAPNTALSTGGESCTASQLVEKGREAAALLHAALLAQQMFLAAPAPPHGPLHLAEQILRCYDRALAALRSGADGSCASSRKRKPDEAELSSARSKMIRSIGGRSVARVETKRTTEDGFMWRKYGQKDIRGSKNPRLYFRCSYKEDRGCAATRQVQQSEDDASFYVVTYFGEHTCCFSQDDDVGAVADLAGDEKMQPFVINFGSSGVSWPSCSGEDCSLNHGEASAPSQAWSLSEGDELRSCTGDVVGEELIEESTPVPEDLMWLSSPDLGSLSGCVDQELGESSFEVDEFINIDELDLFQIF